MMSMEQQLKNLEARLASAVAEVARAESDLNTAREKARMKPVSPSHAKALFTLEMVAAALADKRIHDSGLRALLFPTVHISLPNGPEHDRERIAKCSNWIDCVLKYQKIDDEAAAAGRAAATFETRKDPSAKPSARATAADIQRAAAVARGEVTELPPLGSMARQILEAGARRRSETLDGKPL
jgi:hypothetical protein